MAAAAAAAAHVTSRQANASISCSLFLSFYSHSDRSTSQRSDYTKQRKSKLLANPSGQFSTAAAAPPPASFRRLNHFSSAFENFKLKQASLYGLQLLQWCSFSFIYSLILTRKRGGEKILLKCFTFFVCLFTLHQRGLLPKPFLLFFLL